LLYRKRGVGKLGEMKITCAAALARLAAFLFCTSHHLI